MLALIRAVNFNGRGITIYWQPNYSVLKNNQDETETIGWHNFLSPGKGNRERGQKLNDTGFTKFSLGRW